MGVFYPDKNDFNNIAVDVYVKAGNFNLSFFKRSNGVSSWSFLCVDGAKNKFTCEMVSQRYGVQ